MIILVKDLSITPLVVELIPDAEQGGYTARVPDIPAYGEGATENEASEDLKEALRAYVEAFGLEDAAARLSRPSALRQLDWNLAEFAGRYTSSAHGEGDDKTSAGGGICDCPCTGQSSRAGTWVAVDHRAGPWQPAAENRNSAEYSPRY